MRRKAECFPGRFAIERLGTIRTVREFDEVYTAPHFGFRDASDYYYRASAMRVIDRVRVPALVITAEDDPFVPTRPVSRSARVSRTRTSASCITRHGGHCAFIAEAENGDDGYWAEQRDHGLRNGAHAALQQRDQPLRKVRPESLLFVLEVDVRVLHTVEIADHAAHRSISACW